MEKILLSLISLLLGVSLNGQLIIESSSVLESQVNETNQSVTFTVKNIGDESVNYWWSIDESSYNWSFKVADQNLAHSAGTHKSPCNDAFINVIASGAEQDIVMQILPNNNIGESTLSFNLHTQCGGKGKIVASQELEVKVNGDKSIDQDNLKTQMPLSLYPNPSTDRFKIKDDKNVKHVVILSVIGKLISKNAHKSGQSHNISGLDKGVYLVRLIDEKDKLLDVMRLTKE